MRTGELRKLLSGSVNPLDQLNWLEHDFLPLVVLHLNSTESRKRLALYGGDRIPENERNLTDFRNRISLIIEYEFARIVTMILNENGVNDLFCSYVVANRFPDLEIRNSQGKIGLRFEVKCLQSVAEEKSANFSTLRKDIMPNSDIIVVFLWDWDYDLTEINWDRSPRILSVYAFNASSLATLRDWYWLNNPPSNLGDGFQGFDIRYGINCVNGEFNEEEGNFGKLLRLWRKDFEYRPNEDSLLQKTEADYDFFKNNVVNTGFDTLANQILPQLSGNRSIMQFSTPMERIGYKSGKLGFIQKAAIKNQKELAEVMNEQDLDAVWVFLDKYQWNKFEKSKGRVESVARGKKPKMIIKNHPDG